MTFQAYIDTVRAKTGKTPEELQQLMDQAGVYHPDMTATELVNWLAKEFALGQGHSMAIWAYFKDQGWVHTPGTKR